MLNPADHHMEATRPAQQRLVSAACPIVDHDVQFGADESPDEHPSLPPGCVGVMAVACGIAVANLYYNQPLLSEIGISIAGSPTAVALLPTLTQIGYAVGLFLFVPLGDIIDRRRLILSLLLGVVISLIVIAAAPSLTWLYVASFTVGMSSVLAQVLVAFAGQVAPPRHRGRIIGTLQAGILTGILLARTVSGVVGSHLGWHAMFWLAAVINVGLLPVMGRMLPRNPALFSLSYARALLSLKVLWQNHRQLRTSSLIGALLFAAFSVFWSTLAFHLAAPPFGYGPEVAGLFGLVGVVGASSAPLAGRLTDWYGPAVTVGLGSIITAAAFLIFAAGSNTLFGLALGVIALDAGIQTAMVGNQSTVLGLVPRATSRANTIYMVCYFVGGAVGSYTGGLAWHHTGWTGVSALGLAFAGAAVTIRFVAWTPSEVRA